MPPFADEDRHEMRETGATWKNVLGDRGVLVPWGFAGVFIFAADLRGMEELNMAPHEDDALYARMMGRITDVACEYNRELARAGAD